jgi:hypothetical protein
MQNILEIIIELLAPEFQAILSHFSVNPRRIGGPYIDLPSKKVEQKNPEMQASKNLTLYQEFLFAIKR